MKPYPEYKVSGIDWLGEIPSHWKVSKSAWTFENIGSGTTPTSGADEYYNSGTINWLQTGDLNDGIITSTSKKITQLAVDDKGLKIYPKGSMVIAMYGATIAKTGILDIDATVNQACCVLLPSNIIIIKFAFYYFNAAKNSLINLASGGGQPNISQTIISNFKIILPQLSEQEAIAGYLDEMTGKIDALIGEKSAQVEELRAYRSSLITETVTRGLNPDVSLCDSGIDWLGQIPSHWENLKLKFLLDEPMMYGANESPDSDTNINNPRYIRITDIDENGNLKHDTFRTLQYIKAQPYLLKYGDVLFARSGATVGKTYRFTETYPACFAGYLIKATCGRKLLSSFLIYYTNSQCYNNWKNSIFDQSTIQNIAADKYNNLSVPVPPLSEQQEIADFLDEKTAKIDRLIEELAKQLDELAEYKQAVITEAVTGKVDVRDYKPNI